jgi:hypothetical protein
MAPAARRPDRRLRSALIRTPVLGEVTDDGPFAFWWLAGLRGLRRGEVCGLR